MHAQSASQRLLAIVEEIEREQSFGWDFADAEGMKPGPAPPATSVTAYRRGFAAAEPGSADVLLAAHEALETPLDDPEVA